MNRAARCSLSQHKVAGQTTGNNKHYVCESLSHVQLFANPWAVARQAPLPMEFSRQEYWSGLPFPSPADLPHPGIEPKSPELQAYSERVNS